MLSIFISVAAVRTRGLALLVLGASTRIKPMDRSVKRVVQRRARPASTLLARVVVNQILSLAKVAPRASTKIRKMRLHAKFVHPQAVLLVNTAQARVAATWILSFAQNAVVESTKTRTMRRAAKLALLASSPPSQHKPRVSNALLASSIISRRRSSASRVGPGNTGTT